MYVQKTFNEFNECIRKFWVSSEKTKGKYGIQRDTAIDRIQIISFNQKCVQRKTWKMTNRNNIDNMPIALVYKRKKNIKNGKVNLWAIALKFAMRMCFLNWLWRKKKKNWYFTIEIVVTSVEFSKFIHNMKKNCIVFLYATFSWQIWAKKNFGI